MAQWKALTALVQWDMGSHNIQAIGGATKGT